MIQMAIDPAGCSKTLQRAGMPEALVRLQEEGVERFAERKGLAAKADLALLESNMDKRMAQMELRLTQSFHNILYGFAGVIIAAIALAAAVTIAWLKP